MIAEIKEFVEAMRDVDDGDARTLQFADDFEERCGFGIGKRGAWLVEDENAGALVECSGDFNDLPAAQG
jgi:hypothetical protein